MSFEIIMKDPFGAPPKPMTVTELVRAIGKKPVRMEPRQYKSYYPPGATNVNFTFAAVYPREAEVLVKPLQPFNTCRESACSPISGAYFNTGEYHMVEHSDRQAQNYWMRFLHPGDYMKPSQPTAIIVSYSLSTRIAKRLAVIHLYERLARAGYTSVYPLEHNMYQAVREYYGNKYNLNSQKNLKMVLVVGPAFWHFNIPMASMYMLLLRTLCLYDPKGDHTSAEYIRLASTRSTSGDAGYLRRVVSTPFEGTNLDMLAVCCRRWRILSRLAKPYAAQHQGNLGSAMIADVVRKYQALGLPKNQAYKRVRAMAGPAHGDFAVGLINQLQREKRRVTRTKNQTRSAEESQVVSSGSANQNS